MNKILLSILLITLSVALSAQIPQAFSFQSLVLNTDGNPVRDSEVGVLIEITNGSAAGLVLYSETHKPTTNNNGLYTIEIGNGSNSTAAFQDINWLEESKFISVRHDISGGSDFKLVGSSQLLSVPYALASGISFIEPKIYVNKSRAPITEIDSSDPEADEGIAFYYQWIQGEPEDVFVEYLNLPDNIHIETRKINPNVTIDNFSKVDTIYDGILLPISKFKRTSQTQPLSDGLYDVDVIFRTATRVLAEMKYPITIKDMTEPPVNCSAQYIGTKSLTMSCDELGQTVNSTITIEALDIRRILIKNLITEGSEIEFEFTSDECFEGSINNINGLSTGNLTVEQIEIFFNFNSIEFMIELIDENGNDVFCEIVFQ